MSANRPLRLRFTRFISAIFILTGLAIGAGGATVWFFTQQQLSLQRLVVAKDAPLMRGAAIQGPISAYAQTRAIDRQLKGAADGKTLLELAKDDPNAKVFETALVTRSSLHSAILTFGFSALAMTLGVTLVFAGWALGRLAKAIRLTHQLALEPVVPYYGEESADTI